MPVSKKRKRNDKKKNNKKSTNDSSKLINKSGSKVSEDHQQPINEWAYLYQRYKSQSVQEGGVENRYQFTEKSPVKTPEDYQRFAFDWALENNPELITKLDGVTDVYTIGNFLLRSAAYYSMVREAPFVYAYLVRLPPGLSNEILDASSESVFNSVYESIQNAFSYLELPGFESLFFSPREKIIDGIIINFDSAVHLIESDKVSARAFYIIEEIDRIGGLINAKRFDGNTQSPTIFTKIRGLAAIDKAYVYIYNFLKYRNLDDLLAFNTGYAHFQYGDYNRAFFFYFMSNLFPYIDDEMTPDDGLHRSSTDYWVRALAQKMNANKNGYSMIDAKTCYLHPNNNMDKSHVLYGVANSMHEKIIRNLVKLSSFVEQKNFASVGVFKAIAKDLVIALSAYENEKLQADLIERMYEEIKRFIDFTIEIGNHAVAFMAFEFYKSLILKLSLGDGRQSLLNKLKNEKYYLKLKEIGASLENTSETERSCKISEISNSITSQKELLLFDALIAPSSVYSSKAPCMAESIVLLEYYIGEFQQGVFVCKGSNEPVFFPLNDIKDCKDAVERLSMFLKNFISANGKDAIIDSLLDTVYDALIAPIAGMLTDCKHIIFAPTDFLFQCPFSALRDGNDYLIENYAISIVPSYSVFEACSKNTLQSSKTLNFVMGGDLNLKGINEELNSVSEHFSTNNLQILKQRNDVKEQCNNANIMHIAAHGTFNCQEPLLSRIHLGSSPSESLSVLDLYEMDMNGVSLAVINACVTGKSMVAAADDLFGLVRGFFLAGCPTVINTLWNLHDDVAPVFTNKFYKGITNNDSPLISFTCAIRTLLSDKAFKNPYYWACYQYFGKP